MNDKMTKGYIVRIWRLRGPSSAPTLLSASASAHFDIQELIITRSSLAEMGSHSRPATRYLDFCEEDILPFQLLLPSQNL